jgi:pyruvate/2-oxoglutarate dehydrogenase complex dihydrolipoamide dehydrogenase (E3) component
MEHFDAIVIGAGQAGGPLAGAFAQAGRHTALIEREHVGGTCINEGCTPTKTMVASARVAYLARRGGEYGVATGPVQVTLETVRRRKREIVESFRTGSERRLSSIATLDLVRAEATFTGPKTLKVLQPGGNARLLTAEYIFINAGARPARPKITGVESVQVLDSTSIMELAEVPEHLIVLGGGYIGLEFGQMFRRFGARVTIVQRNAQLLPQEDPDIAAEITRILVDEGIEIALKSEAVSVAPASGGLALTMSSGAATRTITGSHLLAAAGRKPNTDRLGLDIAGIATDSRGFITVDGRLETNVPGVYALGDINGGPAFTHISYDDYRIVRANLLESGARSTRDRLLPYTVFTDPQLGRVGLSETEARRQGRNVRVARMPMSHVARALEMDETRGFMKAIVDADTGQILGCAILGIEGGEIMAMIQLAMMGGLTASDLRRAVFAHPTLAESLNNLFTVSD